MRYPAGHKDRVRGKIVHAAARRFRGRGGEGVAIADLMRDLKLTHGGFYRHFSGKEDLFDEALVTSVNQARERMAAVARAAGPGLELEAIIHAYLSPAHCANPAEGCPVAALTGEIRRHPKRTRETFDRALQSVGAEFAKWMPGKSEADRQRAAIVMFASMAGALNLARATADETLRTAILEQARTFFVQALCRPK